MTLYRNKLSRDDIEYGKVRYHCSHIFARIFFANPHIDLANRWLHDALGTVQNYGFTVTTREVPNHTFH
jgi:hypothetical protein